MTGYRKYYRNQPLPEMLEDETDQMKGLPLPPIQKPYPADAKLVDLVAAEDLAIGQVPLIEARHQPQEPPQVHRRVAESQGTILSLVVHAGGPGPCSQWSADTTNGSLWWCHAPV